MPEAAVNFLKKGARGGGCGEPYSTFSMQTKSTAVGMGGGGRVTRCGCGPRPPAHGAGGDRQWPSAWPPAGFGRLRDWLFLHCDGPLAKVGHTHVITNHDLRGTVWLHPQPVGLRSADSGAIVCRRRSTGSARRPERSMPVAPGRGGAQRHARSYARRQAARRRIRRCQCRHVSIGARPLSHRHRSRSLLAATVPVQWQHQGNTLRAEGELSFTQHALGLEPYSLLFGALRVSDEIPGRASVARFLAITGRKSEQFALTKRPPVEAEAVCLRALRAAHWRQDQGWRGVRHRFIPLPASASRRMGISGSANTSTGAAIARGRAPSASLVSAICAARVSSGVPPAQQTRHFPNRPALPRYRVRQAVTAEPAATRARMVGRWPGAARYR